jgi:lysophospholipase L1-like esterase
MRVVIALLAALVAGFAGSRVFVAARRAASVPEYWRGRMNQPVQPGDFKLVALGDSSVQAIGANNPMQGYVGRIAEYVAAKTGRRVHITNVSSGGTTADIVRDQLPLVDLAGADLVIVANSNDMQRRTAPDLYAAVLQQLVDAVPGERTVFSDLPIWPGRSRYQAILEEATDARGIRRADFAAEFIRRGRLDIFSWLPPHLNSRGYEYWFEAFKPEVDTVLAGPAAPQTREKVS